MTQPLNEDSIKALQDAMTGGLRKKQKVRQKASGAKADKASRQTCWNGTGTVRKGRESMMGEGLGIGAMGMGASKTTRWYGPGELEAETESDPTPEEIAAKKAATVEKSKRTRARNKARKEALRAKEEAGELLKGFRIFLVSYAYGDWEERASVYGGIPKGVSHHHSPHGDLLMVPVIEADEGKALNLDNPYRDRTGRHFWVPADDRDQLGKVFGRVEWTKPLTEKQAREFGCSF